MPPRSVASLPIAIVLGLVALAVTWGGCAQVGPPPGGPVDETPPVLLSAEPGSLAVDVSPTQPLRLSFSEKVDRAGAARALRLIPDVPLQRPHFEDLDVVFEPLSQWPPDTVVVWSLAASLADKHRVKMGAARSGAFTTGHGFPPGSIVGRAAVRDTTGVKWKALRAQLNLPPAEGSRRPTLWREARGDRNGRFRLLWLRPGSGPFGLEVFYDNDGDGRPGDKERQASLDSLRLAATDSVLDVGTLLLLDRKSPVGIRLCVPAVEDSSKVVVWAGRVDDIDAVKSAPVDSNSCATLSLTPGDYEWGAWIDTNADGKFGTDAQGGLELSLPRASFTVEPELPDSLSSDAVYGHASAAAEDSARVPTKLWPTTSP